MEELKDGYVWLVYYYSQEYSVYEGEGQAVGLLEDGKLDIFDLGHCSCYEPFHEFPVATVSPEDFLREPDSVHDPVYMPEIVEKVRELLFSQHLS